MRSIRAALPADLEAVERVHAAAFPTPAEARLVRALVEQNLARVSLLAEHEGVVAGHILLSPVRIEHAADTPGGLGLAPLAVTPEYQRLGLGAALVRAALAQAQADAVAFAVVLGAPAYYSRFGFVPAASLGLRSIYTDGDEFMAMELHDGSLDGVTGLVRYAAPFDLLEE